MCRFCTKLGAVSAHRQVLVGAFLVMVALQSCAGQEQRTASPTFYNCYGRACEMGEYCSNSESFQGCRSCSIVSVWCTHNISHVKENFFPCLHTCELLLTKQALQTMQKDVEKMREKLQRLENSGIVTLGLAVTAWVLPFVLAFFLMWRWVSEAPHLYDQDVVRHTAAPPDSPLLRTLKTVSRMLFPCCRVRGPRHALHPVPLQDPDNHRLQTSSLPPSHVHDDGDDSGHSSHSGSSNNILA